ncbi:MAG: alpha/beta hydrolase [Acidimicrobiales bacterium]|nr:MAG: alpha/beta hydrolase [Acidimicrobiales bacterium]
MGLVAPATHLSAEAQDFLRNPQPPLPELDYSDIAAVEAFREELHPAWAAMNDDLSGSWVSRTETVAGVDVLRFAETEDQLDNDQIIVHLHGGSYIFGSPMTNASLIVPMAQRTGLPVISVDYRLAPEHKCPAATEDAVAVHAAIAESHEIVGLYGESAGGGLALATAVALRDAGHRLPNRLGLLSPWVDLTCSGDTYRTMLHVDPDFGNPNDPPAMAAAYADDGVDSPQASPLFADLSGLPPSLIQGGGREVLLSDSCRLDAALRAAGVSSTLDVWDGLWHVWQLFPTIPESGLAFDELSAFFMED